MEVRSERNCQENNISFDTLPTEENDSSSSNLSVKLTTDNSAEKISEANMIKNASIQFNSELQKEVIIDPLAFSEELPLNVN